MTVPKDPEKAKLYLQRLSESHKGHIVSIETRLKLRLYNSGKKLSEEHKIKLSLSNKGQIPWILGKKHSEKTKLKMSNSKKNISEETRRKRSESLKGKKSGMMGKKHSLDSIEKMRLSRLGKPISPETRQKMRLGIILSYSTLEARQKCRERRLRQILPTKDTLPERILQKALRYEGIKFETHKSIIGQPDIFIEPNICIFADGDYWHNLPRAKIRDPIITKQLENNGYQVFRFWEHEIKKDVNLCINRIGSLLMVKQESIIVS